MTEATSGTEAARFPGQEPQLVIEPIVGWRRWVLSPARWWEVPPGAILRGAWGRAWPNRHFEAGCLRAPIRPTRMLGGLIKILEWKETGRHDEPAPHTECKCGIYAMKPGRVDRGPTGEFRYLPVVTGFVQLSGKVIEGRSGYRGQKTTVIPPFEVGVPCSGGLSTPSPCADPPAETPVLEFEYQGLCSAHLFSVVSLTGQQVDQWLSNTLEQLPNRYQIDVVNIAKGESNGYR